MRQAEGSTTSEHAEADWGESSKTCAEMKHRAIGRNYSNYHDSSFLVGHLGTPKVSSARSFYKSWSKTVTEDLGRNEFRCSSTTDDACFFPAAPMVGKKRTQPG